MKNKLIIYSFPYLLWMSLFFVIPTLLVVFVSFIDNQSWSEIIIAIRNFRPNIQNEGLFNACKILFSVFDQMEFSIIAYSELLEPRVSITILRTVIISLISALFCIIMAIPTAHFISCSKYKDVLLLLLILPFWTNFLIRIFAWIKILGNNGIINNFLINIHLIDKSLPLLYNNSAVTMISIYICFPFAIIPIFSAIEKLDFSLLEASEDLGANTWQKFFYIYLPSIKNGVLSAFIFSFINTFGNYAIAKLVGGKNSYVLGSLVVHNATVGRNMPLAAAISTIICVVALLMMVINMRLIKEVSR